MKCEFQAARLIMFKNNCKQGLCVNGRRVIYIRIGVHLKPQCLVKKDPKSGTDLSFLVRLSGEVVALC